MLTQREGLLLSVTHGLSTRSTSSSLRDCLIAESTANFRPLFSRCLPGSAYALESSSVRLTWITLSNFKGFWNSRQVYQKQFLSDPSERTSNRGPNSHHYSQRTLTIQIIGLIAGRLRKQTSYALCQCLRAKVWRLGRRILGPSLDVHQKNAGPERWRLSLALDVYPSARREADKQTYP